MIRASVVTFLAAAALVPSTALGATTIGSDLSQTGGSGYCTGAGPGTRCTALQITLGTTDQAVPSNGVITRWSVRDASGELALRVIDGPAGQRHVVASGPAVQATGGIQTFPAQIPVRAGQRIGVELGESGYLPFHYRDEGQTTGERYIPALGADPAAPVPGSDIQSTYELLYNATVEPDADGDGLGDETQDPDHGGAGAGGSCPSTKVLTRGGGVVVFRSGRKVFGCLDGARTLLGTRVAHVRLKLFRINGDQLALVRVVRGRSSIQVFNLTSKRRTFSTKRTYVRVAPTRWTVTDLVVAPNGDAAWIAKLRGAPDQTTVWVRHRSRIQAIDTGRIRPTSLTITADNSGVNYTGSNGSHHNSGF